MSLITKCFILKPNTMWNLFSSLVPKCAHFDTLQLCTFLSDIQHLYLHRKILLQIFFHWKMKDLTVITMFLKKLILHQLCFFNVLKSLWHTDRDDSKTGHGQPLLNQIQGCVGCPEVRNFVLKKNLIVWSANI